MTALRSQALRARDRASPESVRAALARAALGAPAAPGETAHVTLGSVALYPHQRDAVARIRALLREWHVALLADDVGLGKTFVALALAREFRQVVVIAPAALIPMWTQSIARTNAGNVRCESLQRFSRADVAHEHPAPDTLIVIDEAHHVRTPATKRYRAIAEYVSGRDLLLLSATPVHNSPRDLGALLALALGEHATHLSSSLLSRVVVRRTDHRARPSVVQRPAITVPHDERTLHAILALPAPLPARDGVVAGALIRLGLLRAWCSSDAALGRALRQRLLRGEALKQALDAGKHPTKAELRSWLVGEQEVQLAFPELLAAHGPSGDSFRAVLTHHLAAVKALLAEHRRTMAGDAVRASALRALARAHPDVPIVAFSQYAETVRAIGRALSDIAGVGVLTGRHARIASGATTRADALASFAPAGQGRPPPPAHQRIHLLLTTDLLAEGVNLQDAGIVVHLDMPWTDALVRQRVGRCVRLGSPHETVTVFRFATTGEAEAQLRVHERLARKKRWAERLIGGAQPTRARADRVNAKDGTAEKFNAAAPEDTKPPKARRRPGSAAECASAVRATLQSWNNVDACSRMPGEPWALPWCAVHARVAGFLAVLLLADGTQALVGGWQAQLPSGRLMLRVSVSPRRLLPLLRECATAHANVDDADARMWRRAQRGIRRWLTYRAFRDDVSDHALSTASRTHHRVRAIITRRLSQTPLASRVYLRKPVAEAIDVLAHARGVAAEHALRRWLVEADDAPFGSWLSLWRSYAALADVTGHATLPTPIPPGPSSSAPTARVMAVLLLTRKHGASRR